MRAAAEIDELAGRVEGNHRLDSLFLDQFALEFLVGAAIELDRFGLGDELAFVGDVVFGELVHFSFDFREIVGSEGLVADEFVEEAVVNGRPDAEFYLGVELKHGGG